MKKCNPGYYAGTSTPVYIPLDNGKQLGWTSDGTPCSFKSTTTSSGYSNGWVNASSSRYNSAIRNLDKSLTTLPESTPYVRPEFVPYTPPVKSFLEEPKYIPPVNKDIEYTAQDLIIKDHSSYLQNKFATFDVGYGQIHSDAIIGTNPTSRGVPFMEEVIDTIRMEVSKGTLHHKLVINAYNRGLVDSDLYHLGIKLSGSTGTTTSGVTLNLCLFDLHQNNLTTYGMNNFLHFFKWQNINEINFSSNKLGDDSCRQLEEAFSASWLPHLFIIDLSNNQITDIGAKHLANSLTSQANNLKKLHLEGNKITDKGETALIKTMKGQVQDIVVLTNKINITDKIISGTKEERIAIYKDLIEKGKVKGTYDAGLVIDKSFLGEIKNLANISKVTFQAAIGFVKCHFSPDDVAVGYAQDSIIAKLPNMLSKTAQYFTKIVNVKNIGECYVYVTEDVWTSEVGQQVVKHDLCLAGETEFCGE